MYDFEHNGMKRPYDPEVDRIDREVRELQMRREELLHRNLDRPLEPQVQSIATLAHEAGEMSALYRSTEKRADRAESKLKTVSESLDETREDRDNWRTRARTAEAEVERLQKFINRSKAARKAKK